MDFTVTVKPTFEDYKQFNRVIHNKLNKRHVKIIVECVLLLLIDAYLFWIGLYLFAVLYLIVCGAVVAFALFRTQQNVKKAWKSNPALREGETVFRFSESGLDVIAPNGNAHVDYDKLYRLIETKTHFYLLTATNMGSGFSKALCTPEQQTFIREHCSK